MAGWLAGVGETFCVFMVLVGILVFPGWRSQGIAFAEQKAEASASSDENGGGVSG